ncbi:MAG TPA: hypothetical protein VMG59_10000 [Phycisphaerae bacterium]|nr:hypothetical protein [Phycisphaerae bacterium]
MSREIPESDWKLFRKLHEIVVERFYQRTISDIERLLLEKNGTSREQFWNAFELMNQRRKEASGLFDDFRRSTALIQLGLICSNELLTAEEMSRFSPGTRATVQRYMNNEFGS